MRRGDIVTVVAPGDYGKPRPAVIIQGDALNHAQPASTIVALITSTLQDAPLLRLTIEPTPESGLRRPSQVQSNRILTIRTERIGTTIGRLNDSQLVELNRLLALSIGLA
jgi:mRNA interferase MazF